MYIYIYYKLKYVSNEIGRILIQLELAKKNLTRLANGKQSFILVSVYLVPFCPSLNLYLPLLSENDSEWLIVIGGTSNEDGKRRRDGIKKKNGRRREEPRVYERWDSCVTRSWRRGRKEGGRKRKENGKPETSSSFYRRSWLAWSWMNWREESRKEKFRERQFASIHEWNETRHRRINTKFLNAFVRDPEIGIEDVAGHTRNLTMNSWTSDSRLFPLIETRIDKNVKRNCCRIEGTSICLVMY